MWTQHFSKEELKLPSKKFLEEFKEFEKEFNQFHGESIRKSKVKIIVKFSDISIKQFGNEYGEVVLNRFS